MKSWFAAVWFITNQKYGVSALGVQRLLGLGSDQTAWSLMHKLRHAMVDPERDKLSGIVEVDETLIGCSVLKIDSVSVKLSFWLLLSCYHPLDLVGYV
jgi:hypothetical protein